MTTAPPTIRFGRWLSVNNLNNWTREHLDRQLEGAEFVVCNTLFRPRIPQFAGMVEFFQIQSDGNVHSPERAELLEGALRRWRFAAPGRRVGWYTGSFVKRADGRIVLLEPNGAHKLGFDSEINAICQIAPIDVIYFDWSSVVEIVAHHREFRHQNIADEEIGKRPCRIPYLAWQRLQHLGRGIQVGYEAWPALSVRDGALPDGTHAIAMMDWLRVAMRDSDELLDRLPRDVADRRHYAVVADDDTTLEEAQAVARLQVRLLATRSVQERLEAEERDALRTSTKPAVIERAAFTPAEQPPVNPPRPAERRDVG